MRIIWAFLFLTSSALAEVPLPRGGTGLELGVSRLSNGKETAIGTSWMYVFEFQPDENLSFFGQAGVSKAETKMLEQTGFTGGVQLSLLPGLGFQIGIATTVNKVDGHRDNALGPMVGLNFYVPVGVFKLGTSVTIIRTQSLQSTALRTGLLIEL